MNLSPATSYDIIGDIHGRFDKLDALLRHIGYSKDGPSFVPPPGHRAIFLGDLIDPKPGYTHPGGVRATLLAVRTMVEQGHAQVVMGNHELNAICFHTRAPSGRPLRMHGSRNVSTHQGTLDDFPDYGHPHGEWLSYWIPWLKTLPLFLDLGGLRAVHACWHPQYLEFLADKSLEDDAFLLAASSKANPEGEAIEGVLKGLDVPLPPGYRYLDNLGIPRRSFRVRWWDQPRRGMSYRDCVFPADDRIPEIEAPLSALGIIPGYPEDAPPVFIGHYFKSPHKVPTPERANVACLDHGASVGGPLVAYRWSGEQQLKQEHFLIA
jgi:hypothetical protein